MASVGPRLPSKKSDKRKRDGNESDNDSSSGSDYGPTLPTQSTEPSTKKPRVIGPSLPSPSEDAKESAAQSDDSSSSDDDDDFGPSLPPANAGNPGTAAVVPTAVAPQQTAASANTLKRDDWMLVPPSGGDWTGRVDPTKLKNRKFNTGKSAKGPSSSAGGTSDMWHETPQEKQARLQREMMGIKDNAAKPASASSSTDKIDAETAKRLKEYNKSRGPTLYEAHQNNQTIEPDDDPSARAFDREKDIGGGLQVNATQRRDMMKKAGDFNSRFSSAKYL